MAEAPRFEFPRAGPRRRDRHLPAARTDGADLPRRPAQSPGCTQASKCDQRIGEGPNPPARHTVLGGPDHRGRSEEHTSELQSLMRISYAVFCLKKKNKNKHKQTYTKTNKCTNQKYDCRRVKDT